MKHFSFVLLLASSLALALPEQLPHPAGYSGGWSDLVNRSATVDYELVDKKGKVHDRGKLAARVVDSNSTIVPKALTILTMLRTGIVLWEGGPTTTQAAAVGALAFASCAAWLALGYQRFVVQPTAPLFLLSDDEHEPLTEEHIPEPQFPSHLLSLRPDVAQLLQRILSRGSGYVENDALENLESVRIVVARSYYNHLAERVTVPKDIVLTGQWNGFSKSHAKSLREILRRKTLYPSGTDLAQMPPELAERLRRDP